MVLSSVGYEFKLKNSIQLIWNTMVRSRLLCAVACNQHSSCHTFDYDSTSSRCRLFEGDLTTGSIILSSSSFSIVGTVRLLPLIFAQTHDTSCETCQENRYEQCSTNTSTCQCPPHTFWDSSICSLQLFNNNTCSQIDACRADLNLTCNKNCNGTFTQCTSTTISCDMSPSTAASITTIATTTAPFVSTVVRTIQTTTTHTLTYQLITSASDQIVGIYNTIAGASSTNSTPGNGVGQYPLAENPTSCINFDVNAAYLNFGNVPESYYSTTAGVNAGVYTIPAVGASIVRSIQFATGVDYPNRDPMTITLEGSNLTSAALSLGSSWTLLYSGGSGLDTDPNSVNRLYTANQQNFTNNLAFTAYRMLLTSQRGNDDCMQFSEMHLFRLV